MVENNNRQYELKKLYENYIVPYDEKLLEAKEQYRKGMARSLIVGLPAFAVVMTTVFVTNNLLYVLLAVVLFFGSIVFIVVTSKEKELKRRIEEGFKTEVVAKVLEVIGPDWIYKPDECIGSDVYKYSKLFPKKYCSFEGDDLVCGKIDKTTFECSEISTLYKDKSGDEVRYRELFKGLFFKADFNKHFNGEVYVIPGYYINSWSRNIGRRYSIGNRPKKVELVTNNFTKKYYVYATDQTTARYILTPAFMEKVLELGNKINKPICFSFIDGTMFSGIRYGKPLFECSLTHKISFDDILEIYNLFHVNEVIVKELNLNTRIWSKE